MSEYLAPKRIAKAHGVFIKAERKHENKAQLGATVDERLIDELGASDFEVRPMGLGDF
ncbi:hypothetical protein K438DRAFT_2000111 [Mycena galopus ATCC 62051]|nr:hypothetical protein K438DRAFT_2000111 [Mycena galopus ATCC 62051]